MLPTFNKEPPKGPNIVSSLVCLALLLNVSCSKDTIRAISELGALQRELVQEYKTENVDVRLHNNRTLVISFINSAFNDLGEVEKQRKAKGVAFFAKNHYKAIQSVDEIVITFLIVNSYFVFHYTQSVGVYSYNRGQLDSPTSSTDAGQLSTGEEELVRVLRSEDPDQTTVFLKRNLSVGSASEKTIELFASATVASDMSSAPRVMRPGTVTFEFYSNSRKRQFSNPTRLVIRADSHDVFSENIRAVNVMGSDADEWVNEKLSQEIPYDQFLKILEGKNVTILLDGKRFHLTAEHLRALQAIRCIEDLKCR